MKIWHVTRPPNAPSWVDELDSYVCIAATREEALELPRKAGFTGDEIRSTEPYGDWWERCGQTIEIGIADPSLPPGLICRDFRAG
jgi:hypothetical protein